MAPNGIINSTRSNATNEKGTTSSICATNDLIHDITVRGDVYQHGGRS
jgi:hypothetical protein